MQSSSVSPHQSLFIPCVQYYELKIHEFKWIGELMSKVQWHPNINVAEVIKMSGNYWRTMGYSINSRNFLYPEEALYLFEEKKIMIEENGNQLSLDQFYNHVLKSVPLQCYLAYLKLKTLDYIVFRHKKQISLFHDDSDVMTHMRRYPERNLLDEMTSFDIYKNEPLWKKALMSETSPLAHVIVTDGEQTFSMQLTLELLRLSGGVPVIFAVVSRSGFVFLEEFTDAVNSLDWELPSLQTPLEQEEEKTIEDALVSPCSPFQVVEELIDSIMALEAHNEL